MYRHHFDYMAEAWARGHASRWYTPWRAPRGERAYELSRLSPPHPNQHRLQALLAERRDDLRGAVVGEPGERPLGKGALPMA